jgi:hypothetical protein
VRSWTGLGWCGKHLVPEPGFVARMPSCRAHTCGIVYNQGSLFCTAPLGQCATLRAVTYQWVCCLKSASSRVRRAPYAPKTGPMAAKLESQAEMTTRVPGRDAGGHATRVTNPLDADSVANWS